MFFLLDKLENIQESRLSGSDFSDIDDDVSRSSNNLEGNKSDEEKSSVSESDILAELDANLAKIAEKAKAKATKKIKFATTLVQESPDNNDDDEEDDVPRINIDPSKLLKVCNTLSTLLFQR